MKPIKITSKQPLSKLLPCKNKEEYPLILTMDMSKQTSRMFMGWCFDHKLYKLRDILDKSPKQLAAELEEKDEYGQGLSKQRLTSLLEHYQENLPKTVLDEYIVQKANNIIQKTTKNLSDFFFRTHYVDLYQDFYIEANSDDYKSLVYMTELCRDGIVIPDEIFEAIDSILRSAIGHSANLSKRGRLKYCRIHNLGGQNKNQEIIRINSCFKNIAIFGVELGEFIGLSFEDLDNCYNRRVGRKIKFLYPIINKIDEKWEQNFYNIVQQDPSYQTMYLRYIKGQSLQSIGDLSGVTREAVRQQELRFMKRYDPFAKAYIDMLSKSETGCFKVFKIPEMQGLFLNRDSVFDFKQYKIHEGFLFTEQFYQKTFEELVAQMGEDSYMTLSEIKEAMVTICETPAQAGIMTKLFVKEGKLYQFKNAFVLMDTEERKPSSRLLTDYIIHKHFKNGIYPLRKEDVKRFNQIAKNEFDMPPIKEHALQARISLCEDMILSDNGKYTHIDFVNIKFRTLDNIRKYIDKRIDKTPVSSQEILNKFKDELLSSGVDNSALLYGIIRYNYPKRYMYNKLAIYSTCDGTPVSISKRCYEYLKAHPKGATKETLSKNAGFLNPGTYSNFIRNYPIMYCKETKRYSIFNPRKFPKSLTDKAAKQLKADFRKYKFCPAERLFHLYEDEWRACGITHFVDLAYACRNLFKDFAIVRNNVLTAKNVKTRFCQNNSLYYFMKAEKLSGSDYKEVRDRLIDFLGVSREEMSKKFSWYIHGKRITVTPDNKIITQS